ncbi:DUF1206 domain-containing protein [Marinobacter fonticola]|uniref:DUF1206 domain-containing protein n=1 Tax=Marinobacter fonticola TaxID=2603215 RepID=UPI0011E63A2D|nr:DUF1206 domain-containing protein [Marinobacter fonticola]
MMDTALARKPFKILARMGYCARGLIYLVVGSLAAASVAGEGGGTTDTKGAIIKILSQPLGNTLLLLLIVGLVGYTAWRLTQAVFDADRHGLAPKGLAIRAALLISAITHGVLAYWTGKLLFDFSGGGGSGGGEQGRAFLATGTGQVVLGAAGILFVVVGLAHLFKGFTARFDRYMEIPENHRIWIKPLCRFGLIARGVVWCMVGWFLIDSAQKANSSDIKGMGEAMDVLRNSPFGEWLLGIVAAGLIAFGLYNFLEAAFRRIRV